MAISRVDKIIVQVLLTAFYACFIWMFISDAIEACHNPNSRRAIFLGETTLKSYLMGNIGYALYFVLGIILLFWKTRRHKFWVIIHATPVIAFVIYGILALCFFPEVF